MEDQANGRAALSGIMATLTFLALTLGSSGSALSQGALHRTGISGRKLCPAVANQGDTVNCTMTARNLDSDHGVENLTVSNAILNSASSSTTQPDCFASINCNQATTTCDPDLTSPKPQPTTLGVTDGVLGGPDTMACTFQETVIVDTCVVGVGNNRVSDRVTLMGEDDGTPDAATGTAETGIVVRCCGNGEADRAGETCDTDPQGSVPNTSVECPTCPAGIGNACRLPGTAFECTLCGDGIVQAGAGEQCDDGNTDDCDACANFCGHYDFCDATVVCGPTPGESCGPAGAPCGPNGNPCRADCTCCGDGITNAGEFCDDGNSVDDDECRNDCTIPVCGDGIVDAQNGETCDPPGSAAGSNGNLCRANCTVCGDSIVNDGEQCDDGDGIDNDECRNDCAVPPDDDGDGVNDADEPCVCLGTSTGAPVTILGCGIDQICPCPAPLGRASWINHSEYVRCVKSVARELEASGAITREQRMALGRVAVQSNCSR